VSGIKLPLTLSLAGHAGCLALLALFLSEKPPALPKPIAKGGIEVVFAPAPPKPEAAPPDMLPPPAETPPAPPEPPPEATPPPPEPPVVAAEPPPPAPEAPAAASEPPPPPPVPQKHAAKKPPKPAPRHQEAPRPTEAYIPSVPSQPPAPVPPPQTPMAATPVPAPVPSPEASAGYRALLSAWLESHKRYPDTARQRGEEGRAVLRFSVDRSGRVLDFTLTSSSGYPDLDESLEDMMRGATLPPFPAGIPQPRMDVSVTIRFSLRR
jgi:periplasmic protein TonB